MSTKLDRDFIVSNLASVEAMLEKLGKGSFLARASLESRLDELRKELQATYDLEHPLASVSLYFGGAPVVGSRGIESEFGAKVISTFQDLVAKVSATRQKGTLGQRGLVPGKDQSKLHITNIVRGSFGFQLDELTDDPQQVLFQSGLKDAVDEAAKIMLCFDPLEGDQFEEVANEIDDRILETVTSFFDLVRGSQATLRLVCGDVDKQYDPATLDRTLERIRQTRIDEDDRWFSGALLGVLPGHRTFEYRTSDLGLLYGKIDRGRTEEEILAWQRKWEQLSSRAMIRVKEVIRQGKRPLVSYTLLDIEEETQSSVV